jgi:hypothetical protein
MPKSDWTTLRIAAAGLRNAPPDMGPPVVLWRKFRGDGRETTEVLPEWVAEWTLSVIPEREPNVERAKIIR